MAGLQTELDSIIAEDLTELAKEYQEKIEVVKQDYIEGAILRREKLDYVASKCPHYDYHKRCQLKHRATAFVQATEVYLADPNDITYDLMWRSEKRFWKVVSQLMGTTIANCGRCLSDQIGNGILSDTIEKGK